MERLNVFIGRWITQGQTEPRDGSPPVPIHASDVYEWIAGGRFVPHTAHGRFADRDIGGTEIIGADPETGQYRTWFFDRAGNVTMETLSYRDGTWTWQGAHIRCSGTVGDDGRTVTARHERSDDGVRWEPSMTVTLRRVE